MRKSLLEPAEAEQIEANLVWAEKKVKTHKIFPDQGSKFKALKIS